MIEILKTLRSFEFYGVGDAVEIAKGKHELITDWKTFKRKIKRAWLSKKK